MKTKMTPVRDLSAANIDSKPQDFDWSEGYAEKWEFFAASEEDGKLLCSWEGDEDFSFDGHGPMMNYYYPVDSYGFDPHEAARALAHLPLCVVEIDGDKYGLALSGGGMDLSWEICEAFMRIGSLPPVHFCELPAMAGRGTSARDRWILSGCRRSLQFKKNQVGRALRRMRETFKEVVTT
jgi:hypothetical protein